MSFEFVLITSICFWLMSVISGFVFYFVVRHIYYDIIEEHQRIDILFSNTRYLERNILDLRNDINKLSKKISKKK